jgi:hypothetical protein
MKIWFSTVLLSPLLAVIIFGLTLHENSFGFIGSLQMLWLMILMGLVFSIPTIILLIITKKFTLNTDNSFTKKFSLLSSLSILGIFLTFAVLDKAFISTQQVVFPLSYMLMMISSIYYFVKRIQQ